MSRLEAGFNCSETILFLPVLPIAPEADWSWVAVDGVADGVGGAADVAV